MSCRFVCAALLVASAASVVFGHSHEPLTEPIRARAILAGKSTVSGMLNVTESPDAGGSVVRITGRITGLTPGKHGFHIHQYGDVFTNGCDSTGGHYNPRKVLHGGPADSERHNGDLGNIVANEQGVANVDVVDRVVSLSAHENIIGRAFVVHAAEDDFGRLKDNEGSTKTGNAGARLACGIIFLIA